MRGKGGNFAQSVIGLGNCVFISKWVSGNDLCNNKVSEESCIDTLHMWGIRFENSIAL